jgi:hypothetical protein
MGNFDEFSRNKNEYFQFQSEYNNEKLLLDLLTTEMYNLHGVCMTYFTVSFNTSANEIWTEDGDRVINRFFNIMTMYDLPKEEELFTKFGIAGLDNFHIYISKRHFQVASKYSSKGTPNIHQSITPRIGDLLRANYNNYIYEIVSVKDTEMQFAQAQHTWDIIVSPFKNNNISTQICNSQD